MKRHDSETSEGATEAQFELAGGSPPKTPERLTHPQIIQNYTMGGELLESRAIVSSDPVGPASDQCWLFTIEDNRITNNGNQAPIQSEVPPQGNCVKVVSRSMEMAQGGKPGKASWVICCRKDNNGKCRNCTALMNLQVLVPDLNKPNPIAKGVVVTCIP